MYGIYRWVYVYFSAVVLLVVVWSMQNEYMHLQGERVGVWYVLNFCVANRLVGMLLSYCIPWETDLDEIQNDDALMIV